MDVKNGMLNKLALRIAQLEVDKSELQVLYENALKENEELKKQLPENNQRKNKE